MRNLPRNIITAIDRFDEAAKRMAFKGATMPAEQVSTAQME